MLFVSESMRTTFPESGLRNLYSTTLRRTIELLNHEYGFNALKDEPIVEICRSPDLDCQSLIEDSYTDEVHKHEIRLLICDDNDTVDEDFFAGTDLLVIIRVGAGGRTIKNVGKQVRACQIACSSDEAITIVTHVLLDIALANSRSMKAIRGRYEQAHGALSFVNARGAYFLAAHAAGKPTFLSPLSTSLCYAPVTIVGAGKEDTNGALRRIVAQNWDSFVLAYMRSFLNTKEALLADLKFVPKVGKVLNAEKVGRRLHRIGAGVHEAIILRRSLRKRQNPVLRDSLLHLFDHQTTLNSVSIMKSGEFREVKDNEGLIEAGFVQVFRIYNKAS